MSQPFLALKEPQRENGCHTTLTLEGTTVQQTGQPSAMTEAGLEVTLRAWIQGLDSWVGGTGWWSGWMTGGRMGWWSR